MIRGPPISYTRCPLWAQSLNKVYRFITNVKIQGKTVTLC